MSQLSFFSAESMPPAVTDLCGLLAGPGQVVVSGDRARISVVVDSVRRAEAVAALIREAGIDAVVARSEEDSPLVRTEALPELKPLADQWTRGAVKAMPAGWVPSARPLRMWAVAAGRVEGEGERFVLGLDPHAPDTHPALAQALIRAGIAPTLVGTRGGSPGLRISGRRRMHRLLDNIGEAPEKLDARTEWPHV
ncbi:hypothetical protein G4H71_08070 [Rhodococcus triatomae]|uniref:Uncharacterized protein n=1 Tax=Rhodococcus triatomae TaxID=300028 RepID=A0A1G8ILG9_9NOCA|nr:hypothetical protein [Rhodococcus triatomae]QNG21089.1 hypothetical protein G4H72_22315 [Rhodococcus triatomae]QNG22999.1 hypothetical protein G4H71_08070 [Rhodococcus triatomae]SDI19878.1 hypothetical protein SAMN05444695_105322 [Rhodococcus triatomae]